MNRPSERTEAEVAADVAYLSSLPLKELRRRQDLVAQQQRIAYHQRNDLALADLEAMFWDLFAAVDSKL